MDIIVIFEGVAHLLEVFVFWFCVVFFGLMIITRPKLLILIPIGFVVFILKTIAFIFVFLLERASHKVIVFLVNREINFFEKSINNIGIKNELDVGACHLYFNRISPTSINTLFYVYLGRAFEEIESGEYEDEQIERYIHLLEIMNRCLIFKPI